jgi:protein kinase X
VYMLLDFVPGGDFFSNLRASRRFSPATVQHYVGCIILALDYVHSRGVVYRDLKPENLLLDIKGRIKLTDFGFAKKVTDRYAPYPTRAMGWHPNKCGGRAH